MLFFKEHFFYLAAGLCNQGVGITHLGNDFPDELVKERATGLELVAVPERPANNPADNIAPSLVRGYDPISDQEHCSSNVICNDF